MIKTCAMFTGRYPAPWERPFNRDVTPVDRDFTRHHNESPAMKFVQFTDTDGGTVYVNLEQISLLRSLEDGRTRICLGSDTHQIVVDASVDEVLRQLNEADPPPTDPTTVLLA
jgi:hypothetical protein